MRGLFPTIILTLVLLHLVGIFGDCPPPPKIKNGDYKPKKNSYATKKSVKYSCSSGFTLYGKKKLKCNSDGQWPATPVCIEKVCPQPPAISGGSFGPPGPYYPDDEVSYMCDPGLQLVGPLTSTCQNNLSWTETPCCVETECGPPPSIPLGTFSPIQNFYFPSDTVTYECCNGITISGAILMNMCQNDGTWSVTGASLPSCTVTVCPPPPSVLRGGVQLSDEKLTYSIGDTITYECHFGVKPGQVASNTCGADGLWTNIFPDICVAL